MAPSWQKKGFMCPHSFSSTYCNDLGLTTGRITGYSDWKEEDFRRCAGCLQTPQGLSCGGWAGSVCVFPETEHAGRAEEWEGEGNKV